ncbi:hypothetical protein [Brevundimonas sp.]|uniref:hypothetical protein n=1 Tax=Brevundimonas sp. TaxID=1871086 RepID=UPI001A310F3A|nr:hypothetical protein [Brevundimonas sp.]MBJ7485092.1 hypothetical protein [Brevundimonas sp.]
MSGLVRIRNRIVAGWRRWTRRPTSQALAKAQVRLGDTARDAGDWAGAALHYGTALSLTPDDVSTLLQHAHALKEAGRTAEAVGTYRAAIQIRSDIGETYLHLAELLKASGDREAAVGVFVEALEVDPGFAPARAALVAMGERRRLPAGSYGSRTVRGVDEAVARTVESLDRSMQDWAMSSRFPVGDYGSWRRAYPPPLPPPTTSEPVLVVVDGRDATPSGIAATLRSLEDQRHVEWTALVVASDDLLGHAVADAGRLDVRVRITGPGPEEAVEALASAPDPLIAWVTAGAVLDGAWLAWMIYASRRARASVAYSDHDLSSGDWLQGSRRSEPALHGQPCPDDLATSPRPPTAALIDPRLRPVLLQELGRAVDGDSVRRLLLAGFDAGPVVHVPLVLASEPRGKLNGQSASGVAANEIDGSHTGARIRVIVPTRDHTDLLERFVSGLLDKAARPGRVHVVVIDNRSTEFGSEAAFARLGGLGVEIKVIDEPFNWSRINNLAAVDGAEDILLFANNDMEMLTHGWDSRLDVLMADARRGVVGARLLYPDGTLQHGGVAMGVNEGRPLHEGRMSAGAVAGPLDRWKRLRSAAAVTGAFLAIRRRLFDEVGGFDEELAIGYSDLDLCYRVRAGGRRVVMDGELELIHHESKTRGLNDGGERIAWDDHELQRFHDRWGDWLFFDPSINPQWVCEKTWVFDGYREAGTRRVLDWIDQAGRGDPWSIDLGARPPDTR